MPNGQPAQLANLRPQWQPGEQPKPGPKYIERMLARGNRVAPQAMALIARTINDPEVPIEQRLSCAKYVVDKHWPKPIGGGEVTIGGIDGADWLDVRFHFPSDTKANGRAETVRVSFDAEGD